MKKRDFACLGRELEAKAMQMGQCAVLRTWTIAVFLLSSGGLLCCASKAQAQVNVLTAHNDNSRTGQNLQEAVLTPANVSVGTFGKLFAYPVDGYVYAQPLYVANVPIPGQGLHNVVFVATEHDSVYAFDADDPATGLLWSVSFLDPANGVTTVPADDVHAADNLVPEIGITSTPVIDGTSGTLYAVAKTKEVLGDGQVHYVQRLHALDITTGGERVASPVVIADTMVADDGSFTYVSGPSVPGAGDGSLDGLTVSFNAFTQLNRPALLLVGGVVYSAWGSHDDNPPYHGWILGHDALSLALVWVFNTTPNGRAGAVWMSGGGLAADAAGQIYVATGNGTFAATGDFSPAYGDSVFKLAPDLTVVDFFTPFQQATLDADDMDFGSSGVLLLPDQPDAPLHGLLAAGKTGAIYLINRDNLGGYQTCGEMCDNVVQVLPDGTIGGAFGTPAYFNGLVYYQGCCGDVLKAFQLTQGLLSPGPVMQTSTAFGYPGSTPSISANGASNGIVWTLQVDAYATSGPAVLHAYDAGNLAQELYNSSQIPTDQLEGAVKFTVPTVANGKVYVGTQSSLAVFGVLPGGARWQQGIRCGKGESDARPWVASTLPSGHTSLKPDDCETMFRNRDIKRWKVVFSSH